MISVLFSYPPSNVCFSSHSSEAQSLFEVDEFHFHDKLVTWGNWAFPTHTIDTREVEDSTSTFLVYWWRQTDNATWMRSRLSIMEQKV